MSTVKVSIFHDDRRPREDGKYPVSLRLFFEGKYKHYQISRDSMPLYITPEQFLGAYKTPEDKVKKKDRELYDYLQAQVANAKDIIKNIQRFSFDAFEKILYRGIGSKEDAVQGYRDYISELRRTEQVNTAESYTLSLRSLLMFEAHRLGKVVEYGKAKSTDEKLAVLLKYIPKLPFAQISPRYLEEYEKFMLQRGNSRTTVGIYTRPLRAVFNKAIADKDIPEEMYPFGKTAKKFVIPSGRKGKKALTQEAVNILFNYPLEPSSALEKGRSFWFFSYLGNGLNVADICNLKYSDLDGDTITFYRTKTLHTTKDDIKPIIVTLSDYTRGVIQRYGNPTGSGYIFSIINESMSPAEKLRARKAFTRFINEQVKAIAKAAGLNEDISSNWGRHSFSTHAVQAGASLEFVQESLGHKSITTTMNYWQGFHTDEKKNINNKLLNIIQPKDNS